jgi:DNA invertase Pin-like site-specific DNA recombinase
MKRAYAYLLVSGKGQVRGDGFPRQLPAIKTHATEHDLKVLQVFREVGVAGNREPKDQPAWTAMSVSRQGSRIRLPETL